MNVVTERNFDQVYSRAVRDLYWEKVERSLEQIFQKPRSLAQAHRKDVERAPSSEQIMVYHQEPIELAADLAGASEITPEQQRQYIEICEGTEPFGPGWPDAP
jgi:hypothetical protein